MSNKIALPFANILKAAAALPVTTGESARFRTRHAAPGTAHVILCDVSGSMDERAGARRRIDHLREALDQVVQPNHILVTFSSAAQRIGSPADLPSPSGGTALESALAEAARHDPRATLVISDGEPTNPEAALRMAEALPGTIDVIYCGDEGNRDAVEFMRRLARLGCGQYAAHSWQSRPGAPLLAATMRRLLLTGPRS
jgi:hypothetical protein